jgi:hypothetical protein
VKPLDFKRVNLYNTGKEGKAMTGTEKKKKLDEERERSYEYGLPEYLQNDLDAYKDGLKNGSTIMDCLWGELYGSINIAEINEGSITPEHADYLRKKYLFGGCDE